MTQGGNMPSRASLLIGICLSISTAAHADFSVSNKPTHDVSCDAGVCVPTAQNANLNVSELTAMLASGDAMLQTATAITPLPSSLLLAPSPGPVPAASPCKRKNILSSTRQ